MTWPVKTVMCRGKHTEDLMQTFPKDFVFPQPWISNQNTFKNLIQATYGAAREAGEILRQDVEGFLV